MDYNCDTRLESCISDDGHLNYALFKSGWTTEYSENKPSVKKISINASGTSELGENRTGQLKSRAAVTLMDYRSRRSRFPIPGTKSVIMRSRTETCF